MNAFSRFLVPSGLPLRTDLEVTVIHLVTFATKDMSRSRARCVCSAVENGVEQTHPFDPSMLPCWYLDEWKQQRGFGCWRWKPLIIDMAMRGCLDDDILIYADAGVELVNNPRYVIDRMDQDLWLFGNHWPHYAWCKRDIIDEVWPLQSRQNGPAQTGWEAFGKQVQASVIFFRVNDRARAFVKEWLYWCLFEDGRLVDDSPSRAPNHPEFQENRHDQAILTTMAYQDGFRLHYWPARYDGGYVYEHHPEYQADDYPTLFFHHRRRNADW